MSKSHAPRPRLIALFLAVFSALTFAPAQTLAHPGWVGNGLSSAPWWQRAIFYRINPMSDPVDPKAIAQRLDALRALGVDALLLPAPELPPPGSGEMPNLDAFDELLRQAGSRDIRVLLMIRAPSGTADISGLARFWLNRGIAGLYVPTPAGASPQVAQAQIQELRKIVARSPGQRIIVADSDLDPPSNAKASARRPSSESQLRIDPRLNRLTSLDAASLRPILAQSIAQPNLLLDLTPPASGSAHPNLAQIAGTICLLTHAVGLIDSAANLVLEPTPEPAETAAQPEQPAKPAPKPLPPGTYEPYVPYVPPARPHTAPVHKAAPPDPLTVWYGKLTALHRDNAVIRLGSKTFLDFDAQNALVWVNRPAKPSPTTPPVVVICNLSSSPAQLSLTDAMNHLNLHGWFLRPLLRSYEAMGAQPLDSINVPPFGVYVGELRR